VPADGEIVVLRPGGLTLGELRAAGVDTAMRLPIAGVQVVSALDDRAAALATLRADPDAMRLARGRWRVTVATRAGSARLAFRVR
jgi:hypothetical protein